MLNGISNATYKKRITVFTPTFNRAYIIVNLYRSLKSQSFKDFEWLIVDDGSTDNTRELITFWQNEKNDFSIRYYYKKNGGKHRAVNYGLKLAEGELFFVVDSDDYLTVDALEKIDCWFKEARDDYTIKSVSGNKGESSTFTKNEVFREEYLDKSFLDMGTYREDGKLVLAGERAIAFYTDFHRKYLYPEFEGENFLTEAIVYNRMANDGYKTRFFNDIIWIYAYRDDGLSAKGSDLYLDNPKGYGMWFRERADFLDYSILNKLKMRYSFYCDLKDKYTNEVIAECIGAPVWQINLAEFIHSVRRKIKQYKANRIRKTTV